VRLALVLVAALALAGFAAARHVEDASSAFPCDRKPDHPKCKPPTTTTPTTTTPPPPPPPPSPSNGDDLPYPIRGAFYYGNWYPGNWFDQPGCDLTVAWSCASIHMPAEGYYSHSYAKARLDSDLMQRGGIRLAIATWHGPTHRTDPPVADLLRAALDDAGGFQWTVYYELEGSTDPSVAKLQSDLTYLRDRYANHPNWLWKNGKPVVFVYKNGGDCEDITRWAQATGNFLSWFVQASVHGDNGGTQLGYRACPQQPSSWHQYAGEPGGDHQPGYSFTIAPEVWIASQAAPKMPRDLERFRRDAAAMRASGAPWQLVNSFNEWGESTSVEPGTHRETGVAWGTSFIDALP
jgi:hypothetical protein